MRLIDGFKTAALAAACLLAALFFAYPLAAQTESDFNYEVPTGPEGSATIGGFDVPFIAVLPFFTLVAWLAGFAAKKAGISGLPIPVIVACVAAASGVVLSAVFGMAYEAVVAAVGAALAASWAHSVGHEAIR